MSKIVDYTLDHPTDKFSGTDEPKENPYEPITKFTMDFFSNLQRVQKKIAKELSTNNK